MARLSFVRQRRIVASATALGLLIAGTVSYTLQAATNPSPEVVVSCSVGGNQTVSFVASGPDSATAGADATTKIESVDGNLPTSASGLTISNYQNISMKVVVTGASVASATITQPGTNGADNSSVTVDGNTVTLTMHGPVPAGQDFATPEVSIATSVTASAGGTTGFGPGSPFYGLTAYLGTTPVNVECDPADAQQAANATLTIPVEAPVVDEPDTEPPAIQFIEPNESSVYAFGEEIVAAYTCSDASLPVTCEGTVPNGEPLDTSSAGAKEFTITATDALGNISTETIEYAVLPEGAPPPVRPRYAPLAPVRLLDTRSGDVAESIDGEFVGGGKRASGDTIALDVAGRADIPDDAIAVVLNVTATENEGPGYTTVYPCGEQAPVASNLNYEVPNDTRPNAVLSRIGDDGQVCLFTYGAPTHLVVDVAGYFPFGARYVGLNPGRLLDTRPDQDTIDAIEVDGATEPDGEIELQVGGRHNVPDNALAAVLNVTAVSDGSPGYVTAYPCGEQRPTASNVNFDADSRVVPNLVVAKLGDDGKVCFFTGVNGAHLIVDVAGYLPAGSEYVPLNPGRVLDTRPGNPTVDGEAAGDGVPAAGSPIQLQVGGRHGVDADALAVVLNVTATEPAGPGYLTVFPCDGEPNASNVNFAAAGQTRANAVVAKLSDSGEVCIVARPNTAHVVVDVAGFVPAQEDTPPPPPPSTTTTTTPPTTVPASTVPPTTDPSVPPTTEATTTTTVPAGTCLAQATYDVYALLYATTGLNIWLQFMAQLDPDGNGNACD